MEHGNEQAPLLPDGDSWSVAGHRAREREETARKMRARDEDDLPAQAVPDARHEILIEEHSGEAPAHDPRFRRAAHQRRFAQVRFEGVGSQLGEVAMARELSRPRRPHDSRAQTGAALLHESHVLSSA